MFSAPSPGFIILVNLSPNCGDSREDSFEKPNKILSWNIVISDLTLSNPFKLSKKLIHWLKFITSPNIMR